MKFLVNIKFNKKSNKLRKKGFTLIELVAVLAIIAILSATFVPKFTNYITEAKKVAILNKAKSVVTAYEAVSHKISTDENDTKISTLINLSNSPLDDNTLLTTLGDISVSECKDILESNGNFTIKSNGNLDLINGIEPSDPTD